MKDFYCSYNKKSGNSSCQSQCLSCQAYQPTNPMTQQTEREKEIQELADAIFEVSAVGQRDSQVIARYLIEAGYRKQPLAIKPLEWVYDLINALEQCVPYLGNEKTADTWELKAILNAKFVIRKAKEKLATAPVTEGKGWTVFDQDFMIWVVENDWSFHRQSGKWINAYWDGEKGSDPAERTFIELFTEYQRHLESLKQTEKK